MYYVYLLKSKRDGTLYIGCTENLGKRVREHNAGKMRSTKGRVPYQLVHYEEYQSKTEALSREYQLKHNSKKKALLIEEINSVLEALSSSG